MLGGFPPMDCPCIDICWAICRVWSAAVCVGWVVCGVGGRSLLASRKTAHVHYYNLISHNFCSVGPISVALWFSECWEKTLSDGMFSSQFLIGLDFELLPHLYIAHAFCQKQPRKWSLILIHHLKELTLSYQKIIKSLKLDHPNPSYGRSKIPACSNN